MMAKECKIDVGVQIHRPATRAFKEYVDIVNDIKEGDTIVVTILDKTTLYRVEKTGRSPSGEILYDLVEMKPMDWTFIVVYILFVAAMTALAVAALVEAVR